VICAILQLVKRPFVQGKEFLLRRMCLSRSVFLQVHMQVLPFLISTSPHLISIASPRRKIDFSLIFFHFPFKRTWSPLTDFFITPGGEWSLGTRQRLGFGMATHSDPLAKSNGKRLGNPRSPLPFMTTNFRVATLTSTLEFRPEDFIHNAPVIIPLRHEATIPKAKRREIDRVGAAS